MTLGKIAMEQFCVVAVNSMQVEFVGRRSMKRHAGGVRRSQVKETACRWSSWVAGQRNSMQVEFVGHRSKKQHVSGVRRSQVNETE